MTTAARHDAPRYATLRDYLRVVRRNRILIALVAVAFAGAAYALTSREKATYQAQASLFFQDTSTEANLLGNTAVFPTLPDVTRAQLNAQEATRLPVLQKVKAELNSPLSLSALANSVGSFVNTQTNEVVMVATSSDPVFAQRVSNAFALALQTIGRDQARARFARLASGAQAQLKQFSSQDPYTKSVYANRIATLRFLAQTADPVQIVQFASLPSAPTGPRTVRNTILALLLGLTVGLLMAFLRDVLDRRLRGTAEIGEQLGWPILGHVRDSAFGVPVFVLGNGKASVEQEGDRESFRILRQNVRFLDVDNSPKTVVVTSALPDEGKSTVAGALACAGAAGGTRTLLVECDLRRPSLAQRFGLNKAPGLTDFLLGQAAPSDILQVIEIPVPVSANGSGPQNGTGDPSDAVAVSQPRRLACITAGRQAPETAELLGSARFKAFLKEVSVAYELVVLDASPLLSVADTTLLLPEAQATLICVRAGQTTRQQAMALKQAMNRLPHQHVGIVVTGVRARDEDDLGYYSYAYTSEPAN